MNDTKHPLTTDTSAASIRRGHVLLVHDDGSVVITLDQEGSPEQVCDVLIASPLDHASLAPGDEVLAWLSGKDGDRGVVLGRVGRRQPVIETEIVLEAKQSLTLRVGDGSITIREDGKILIKGKDLVSHATRMNRIKGGAVQIN